ncbi:MAG: hypothetical protein PVH46_06715 [Granulosicoccaceae bacterium]|jgi:hypothetical protein
MKSSIVIPGVLGAMLALATNFAMAEKVLSANEARALFSNKTFDGHNESKGKDFRVFSSADGVHNLQKSNGKRKQGEWRIDDEGHHCVSFGSEKCTQVIDVGGGVYHKVRNGEHTHTLKNFVDGNQL